MSGTEPPPALPVPAPLAGTGVRVVESQSQVATMELVDDLEEQRVLEELLEGTKPGRLPEHRHYLLSTPFRYPPLRHGSRYGTEDQRGIFYGSERLETALAETAFYALLFGSHAEGFAMPVVDKTSFVFVYATEAALDTTASFFDPLRDALERPGDYATAQRIGRRARELGVEVIRFRSLRCPDGGANLAVLASDALEAQPRAMHSWRMRVHAGRVDFLEANATRPRRASFSAEEFAARGADAHPCR
ncbi:MAG: RES family NAD+ phosphorylase [Myxococcota bacterium]